MHFVSSNYVRSYIIGRQADSHKVVQMLGLLPGVPPIHVTYVHMVTAFLLYVPVFKLYGLIKYLKLINCRVAIVWNTFVPVPSTQVEENKTPSVKEDKPTAGKKREISKEETKKEEEISPWDDLRAHPSAFLATRLNKMMPWPFPMGKAASEGKELWWEKGTHLQLCAIVHYKFRAGNSIEHADYYDKGSF